MHRSKQSRPGTFRSHKTLIIIARLFGVSAVPPAKASAVGERRPPFAAGVQHTRVGGVNDEQVKGFFHLLERKGRTDARDGDYVVFSGPDFGLCGGVQRKLGTWTGDVSRRPGVAPTGSNHRNWGT